MLNPIALAIPVFFVAMGAELALCWRRGRLRGERPVWRFVDAVGDLACGISSQVTGLLLSAVVAAWLYVAVYDAAAIFVLPGNDPWVWLGAFVGVDFFYYWWHRASHRVNLLWAAHVVHHQSEDYNLAVALRQAIFTPLTAVPFYLPLAVLGVPPVVYLTCQALNTLYQFWIHTRLVGRLSPIDLVFNTPTHPPGPGRQSGRAWRRCRRSRCRSGTPRFRSPRPSRCSRRARSSVWGAPLSADRAGGPSGLRRGRPCAGSRPGVRRAGAPVLARRW